MKKLRSFLLSLAMIFVVVLSTACSSKEATATKTFVKEQNGVKVTLVYTYIESEDKVVKQTSKTEALFSAFKGRDIEQVKKQLQDISAKFHGIKGRKETVDIQEDKFIEEVEVDYSELDYEKAKNLPGMIFSGDPTKTKVSMENNIWMILKTV